MKMTLVPLACALALVPSFSFAQEPAAAASPAAAAAPAPELIDNLTKELGATPEQAKGAAGALFGIAKTRLKPEEFGQVAAAVPGMDTLLTAAPAVDAAKKSGADSLLQAATSAAGVGGLANAASAFTKLGLKPEMVGKAIPVLVNQVTKSGGPAVANLLASALK